MPRILLALAVLAALMGSGCAAPVLIPAGMSALEAGTMGLGALQAGTAAYSRRKLVSTEAASLEDTAAACERAMESLAFRLEKTAEQDNSTYIRGREVSDRAVQVRLTRRTPRVTEISIQVGLLGDQTMSLLVLNAIKLEINQAGSTAPASGTETPREGTAARLGP